MNPLWLLGALPLAWILSRWLCRTLGLVRPNFQGVSIPAATGLTFVLVSLFAQLIFARQELPYLGAVLIFGVLGFLDDRFGDRSVGGFRGHVRAIFQGKPTTGSLKLIGGGLTALGAAFFLHKISDASWEPAAWVKIGLQGLLIALSANAINLLDTRPGRAHFGFLVLALPSLVCLGLAGISWPLALVLLAILVEWPFDARARSMMGDTGANFLGALGGVLAVIYLPLWGQGAALILLSGLNIASERVSLQKLIASTPALAALDRCLGVRKNPA
jgi:UDP-GlcNAc:undecaprenyl-phosphate/decaprenyl-phosphate GlcNAc-1-phosphate transferase